MSSLHKKSLVELRGIAQSYNIPDIFKKDAVQLAQAIELKQQDMIPKPSIDIPKPEYDARLMTKPPSKRASPQEIDVLLAPYKSRGLIVEYTEEMWKMRFGKKTDQGTLRMPLRVVVECANRIME